MKARLFFAVLLVLAAAGVVQAQEGFTTNYNYAKAFGPLFYNNTATVYRSASGYPGPAYWQNRADYNINATLNSAAKSMSGDVTIKYTNNSPDELDYIWLQLDQNLFKKDSRGAAMIGGNSRYGDRGHGVEGGYKINGVTVQLNGKTVTAQTVTEDTRMQLRLPAKLRAKGGVAVIKMNFSFNIPQEGSDRMGWLQTKNGVVFAIAQWYPRVCVYDDVLGWNTFPYLGSGEFYCEYGDYEYKITAPADEVVLGSGELVNAQAVLGAEVYKRWQQAKGSDAVVHIIKEAELGKGMVSGTKTWIYKMYNTRDVAFGSSKAFIVDGARINFPSGRKGLALSAQPAESYTADGWQRGAEFTKAAIELYSKRWFEYPYPMAVNIACNVGGMEYPGTVFCSWRARGRELWGVTSHEFGHSWFPMIVGSNERKYGWMDEGFNTFINGIAAADFNNGEFKDRAERMDMVGKALIGNVAQYENVMQTPDGMGERNIGINLYMKPGIALNILRNDILGAERFDYAFRQYINHWAYKHPTPFDFFRSMENGAGEDLSYFWRSWFLENDKFDQAIISVAKTDGGYSVQIGNKEQMVLPVVLQLNYTDGTSEVRKQGVDVWMRNNTWIIPVRTNKVLKDAVLDPEKHFPDRDRSNNTAAVK